MNVLNTTELYTKIGRDSEFYVMYNLTTILKNKINGNNFYFYVVRSRGTILFFRFFSPSFSVINTFAFIIRKI